ncbi:MAG: isoaspartyl peptidase/L-asparaginase [Thermoanaerobaculia bacterium]
MTQRACHRTTLVVAVLLALVGAGVATAEDSEPSSPIVMVVHGGAGTILKKDMTPELEASYQEKLSEGLLAGYRILVAGGSSLDAVEATIRIFEDSPLFNAGKGAVFTAEGKNELDASIMVGSTRQAGAVAGVTGIKNPITAARAVMEATPHVLLAGQGAEIFAAAQGIELVEPSYFFTQRRWDALERARAAERVEVREAEPEEENEEGSGGAFGTVGALALDREGILTAGTSTGGMTNKRHGRVGDSPIIGAGTYANEHCAASGTGHGEFFIRYAVAYDICARVELQGLSIEKAAELVINDELKRVGGSGGVIALDNKGNFAMPFNTEGMYRGYIRDDGKPVVQIYK